ncbi:exonuclease V [Xylariomycetidae sp. FL2044]|nr:exonuclease V [Xylariomycetidae sp. FL2044]
MATTSNPLSENININTSARDSDYGSDLDEDIVDQLQLLADVASQKQPAQQAPTSLALPPPSDHVYSYSTLQEDLEAAVDAGLFVSSPFILDDQQHVSRATSAPPLSARAESPLSGQAKTPAAMRGKRQHGDSKSYRSRRNAQPMSFSDVKYPDLSRALARSESEPAPPSGPAALEPAKDTRSPIERFRSFPKKPLTVTDMASGAWCELQHWYTLTLLPGGRKTRTTAMRGGSRVHQTLEDQVHTTVQVNIATKEEAFALRLWNVVQGLRTLRETGMTRELEVWGTVEGQVINGIIDQVSHESPDASFEQELHASPSSHGVPGFGSKRQSQMTDFLHPHRRRYYLTDVKTRGSTRLPNGAALRPARVQLFLYHRLLGNMASQKVDYPALLNRYGLRPEVQFSDAFMAQMGNLHDEVFYDADSDLQSPPLSETGTGYPESSPDLAPNMTPASDLIRYRCINQIIPLLQTELQDTFPQGADTLGDLLSVQYRHRDDGHVLGSNIFPNDPSALDGYMRHNLDWWRGSREAEGVAIEETFKCRSCEFAENCQWRKDKEKEYIAKRTRARAAS